MGLDVLNRLRLRFTAPPEGPGDGRLCLRIDGAEVPVVVRRHPSARRLTLRVRGGTGEVTLTIPTRAPLASARAFLERHRDWIASRRSRAGQAVPFAAGAVVPVRGVPHRVVVLPGHRGRVRPAQADDGAPILLIGGEAPHHARRLRDHLRAEARLDLSAAVARHAKSLGVNPAGIALRDTISRWGSCAASGTLSFSWRLILAPPFVLDYIAAHEVAHLMEMNHGPRFWTLCRRLAPQTQAAKTWLLRNGADLHRYGAA